MLVVGVVFTPEQVPWLRAMIDPALKQLRRDGIALAAEHAELVKELDQVAARVRAGSASGTSEYRNGPDVVELQPIDWITIEQTAAELEISRRGARALAQRGRLKGRKAGQKGQWLIEAESVVDYGNERKKGA